MNNKAVIPSFGLSHELDVIVPCYLILDAAVASGYKKCVIPGFRHLDVVLDMITNRELIQKK